MFQTLRKNPDNPRVQAPLMTFACGGVEIAAKTISVRLVYPPSSLLLSGVGQEAKVLTLVLFYFILFFENKKETVRSTRERRILELSEE